MVVRTRAWATAAVTVACSMATAGCATTNPNTDADASGSSGNVIQVAASINAWGSILEQLGGDRVTTTSIVSNPATDPHDYEPTPQDGVVIAKSKLFLYNGVGYDSWAAKSLAAGEKESRQVIDVGKLVGVPDGGNPHRWYSRDDVTKVANAITADLKKLDPSGAPYYDQQNHKFFSTQLRNYNRMIENIRTTYAGTPVGASESVFAPLAATLGLKVLTPPSFLQATSEGSDATPADLATITAQIKNKRIKVYVYNSQNATPDIAVQVKAAKAAGIPVVTVTESLSPVGATFQQWQEKQLQALTTALATATGK